VCAYHLSPRVLNVLPISSDEENELHSSVRFFPPGLNSCSNSGPSLQWMSSTVGYALRKRRRASRWDVTLSAPVLSERCTGQGKRADLYRNKTNATRTTGRNSITGMFFPVPFTATQHTSCCVTRFAYSALLLIFYVNTQVVLH